jgi:hypothetical protein
MNARCSSRRPALLLASWLAAGSTLPAPAAAQRPANAREQVVLVTALDKDGKPAATLGVDDLVVREDGVAREILRISRANEPMQLALLVDNSAVTESIVVHLREGLSAFVSALGPAHDISLVTYAERPTLVTSLSADRAEVLRAVGRLFAQPNSGAYLLDALDETLQGFIKRRSARPVIVVVGTEGTEFSNEGYDRVLDRLEAAGAQLHVLLLQDADADASDEERYRSIVVDRGTHETGGRRDTILSGMGFPSALKALAAELEAQFRVVYARPDSLIPPRDVEIRSQRAALEVRGIHVKARD